MDANEISKYLDIALRRRYWAAIPFLLTLLGGLTYLLVAPKMYEAQTLILVQPQRVPENFVKPIVSVGIEERLRTVTQQVTSRTNLEPIIKEYRLFDTGHIRKSSLDEKVELFRKRIGIEVGQKDQRRESEVSAFTITFQYEDSRKAMQVTNVLASNFISENLKIRESQAMGTSGFLKDEVASVERRLEEKEEELKQYREKYMGGLPEQLETNLKILERLQAQLDQLQKSSIDAENRKMFLRKEITEAEKGSQMEAVSPQQRAEGPKDLPTLKKELAFLESRYTEKHPDVVRLKEMIARLESEGGPSGRTSTGQSGNDASVRMDKNLSRQADEIEGQLRALKSEIEKTKSQIAWYSRKVEETPKREQELFSLNRDYKNLKDVYTSLLNRKLEAEIAVSMERKQQGEQFRVLDPAKVPTEPISPNVPKVILMIFVLAVGLGGGVVYVTELMDTSFKMPEDLEKEYGIPVLISLPMRYTAEEIRRRKRLEFVKAASIALGFLVLATSIVLATKGMDATLDHLKSLLGVT